MLQNKVDSILGLIGFAYKSRKLVCGCDLVCDSVRSGKAKVVLYASDASENTIKRIGNCCKYYECTAYCIPVTCERLGKQLGDKASISSVSVFDNNLAKGIIKHIESENVSI